MKRLLYVLIVIMCSNVLTHAGPRKKKRIAGPGFPTEQALVEGILQCLRQKDAYCYDKLFPEMELLAKVIYQNAPNSTKAYQIVWKYQQQAPSDVNEFDSLFGAAMRIDFDQLIEQGKDLNIHWEAIILQRFELEKKRKSRDTVLEKIIPERFYGDVFFADALTGISFAMRVNDMNKINGRWYGGQILHVFPVDNKDDLLMALEYEEIKRRKLAAGDSSMLVKKTTITDTAETEEISETEKEIEKREVQDRKLYKGKFDDEIPVALYIRYLKGDCGEPVCGYDGLLKFGDQDEYIPLKISRTADGQWHMEEDGANGIMDLQLLQGMMSGTWTSKNDKTVYEVLMEEHALSAKRIDFYDKQLRILTR